MRRCGRALAGLALALGLTGCPAGPAPVGPDTGPTEQALPGPGTPPPTNPRPLTALRATVPLTAEPAGAVPDVAVATPDGGAYVVVTPPERGAPLSLATFDRSHRLVRTVPVPRLEPVWDVNLLPGGQVLVSGEFRSGERAYGFEVVDPRTGHTRASRVIPFENGTVVANGRSTVSDDGRLVYLFLSTFVEDRHPNLLIQADVATGRQLNGRDLFEEVRDVTEAFIQPFSVWMFPRQDGGVQLLFDAFPSGSRLVPTVLRYDEALEPAGAVQLTAGLQSAETQAVALAPDGTLYISAEAMAGDVLLSLPPGGTSAIRLLELAGHTYDYALSVDSQQHWVLLPSVDGVRAVDLVTGGMTDVDVGCRTGRQVRDIVPLGSDGGALLLGQCDSPRPATPTVWFTSP